MGQYVYEQLIPMDSLEKRGGAPVIPKKLFLYEDALVLGCDFIGLGTYKSGIFESPDWLDDGYIAYVDTASTDHDAYKYIKIVYTQMPEEGGGYYGYNSY